MIYVTYIIWVILQILVILLICISISSIVFFIIEKIDNYKIKRAKHKWMELDVEIALLKNKLKKLEKERIKYSLFYWKKKYRGWVL